MNELDEIRLYYVDYFFELLKSLPADEGRARWEVWDRLFGFSSDIGIAILRQAFEESQNWGEACGRSRNE